MIHLVLFEIHFSMFKRARVETKCLFDRLSKDVLTHFFNFIEGQHEELALFAAFPHLGGDKIDWVSRYNNKYTPVRCGLETIYNIYIPQKHQQLLRLQDSLFRCSKALNTVTLDPNDGEYFWNLEEKVSDMEFRNMFDFNFTHISRVMNRIEDLSMFAGVEEFPREGLELRHIRFMTGEVTTLTGALQQGRHQRIRSEFYKSARDTDYYSSSVTQPYLSDPGDDNS